VKERIPEPVRTWLSQALAFARSAEPRAPLSRRAIVTDIVIAAVALVASLLAVRSSASGQAVQFILDPHTGRLYPRVASFQHAWKHGASLPILLTAVPLAVRRRFPLGAFAVVLLLLLIFILENGRRVDVAYFGAHGHLPLGVALLLAAVLGILMVVIPGTARIVQLRLTARRHRRSDAARLGASQQQPSTAAETPAPGRR